MKKRFVKTRSAPDILPRLEIGRSVEKFERKKQRLHSASKLGRSISPRHSNLLSVNNLSFLPEGTATFRSAPTPFPLVRSAAVGNRSLRLHAPPVLTILQTEFDTEYPASLKQSLSHVQEGSAVSGAHSDIISPSERGVFMNPRMDRTFSKSSFGQAIGSRTDSHSGQISTYTRKQQRPRNARPRQFIPRTPAVSPVGNGSLEHDYRSAPCGSSGQTQTVYCRDKLCPSEQREDDSDSSEEAVPSVVTCPVLTQEVLSQGLQSHAVPTQDRVFDWLASCDEELRDASLPPHLPDIGRLKRYNTSVA